MYVISLDGPAKAGKTCIGTALAREFEAAYDVEYHVAGNFYRAATAAVIEAHDLPEDAPLPDEAQLDSTLEHVLTSSRLYGGDWGDLQRPEISNRVSIIGSRAVTQAAADNWWQRISHTAHANGAEVLLVDGRNPRARLQSPLAQLGIDGVIQDLFVTCSVEEAARRTLAGKPHRIQEPTDQALREETMRLAERRRMDEVRADNPFLVPDNPVIANGQSAEALVLETLTSDTDETLLPRSVYFDTSDLPKPAMRQRAIDVAQTALHIVAAGEVVR